MNHNMWRAALVALLTLSMLTVKCSGQEEQPPFNPAAWLEDNYSNDNSEMTRAFEASWKEKPIIYKGTVARINAKEQLVVFKGGGLAPKNWDVQVAFKAPEDLSQCKVGQELTVYGFGSTLKIAPFGFGNSYRIVNATLTEPAVNKQDATAQSADSNHNDVSSGQHITQKRLSPAIVALTYHHNNTSCTLAYAKVEKPAPIGYFMLSKGDTVSLQSMTITSTHGQDLLVIFEKFLKWSDVAKKEHLPPTEKNIGLIANSGPFKYPIRFIFFYDEQYGASMRADWDLNKEGLSHEHIVGFVELLTKRDVLIQDQEMHDKALSEQQKKVDDLLK